MTSAYAIAWFAQHVDDNPATKPASTDAPKNIFDGTSQFWHFYSLELDVPIAQFANRKRLLQALKDLGPNDIKGGYFKSKFPLPVESNSKEIRDLLKEAKSDKWKAIRDATFGMVLHTYEDSWAHEGFQMPKGHAGTRCGGHAPDYPWV